MPLLDMDRRARGRVRVFVRAQLPFLLAAAFVFAVTAVAHPAALDAPLMKGAAAIVVVVSVATVAVPWERGNAAWTIVLPLADIVAVAFVRAELIGVIPSAGMLVVFPVLWLAYGFRAAGIPLSILCAGFVTALTFAYRGAWPSTPLEWVNVVTLPSIVVAIAVIVNLAARHLRRGRRQLADAHEAQSRALQRAVDNELVMRSILETVHTGVAFYDFSGRLALANRPAVEMSRQSGFDLATPPYAGDLVFAADRTTLLPYDRQLIPRALRGERLTSHLEWLGRPDDPIAVLASSDRVRRDDGTLLGTVVAAYDVTELANAVEVREEFLRTVSHELRTPLTNITGYLELIDEGLGPDAGALHSYAEAVHRNVDRLMDRIRELLAASDTNEPLRLARTDVAQLVAEALRIAVPLAERRGTALEHLGEAPLFAVVDPERLRQAVGELVVNAVKFGPAGSTVVVAQHRDREETARRTGSVVISVTDSGPGLSPGEQTRVFDRFYRTPYARTQAIQGFGIGLSLVRDVVAAHGGQVRVDSGPDGTRFSIEIPVDGVARTGQAPDADTADDTDDGDGGDGADDGADAGAEWAPDGDAADGAADPARERASAGGVVERAPGGTADVARERASAGGVAASAVADGAGPR